MIKRISHVNIISMATGVLTPLTLPSGAGIPTEISSAHISSRNINNEAWVCVTWFEPTANKRYGGEATMCKVDGSLAIARAAHCHSDTTGSIYQAEKHGVASPDGRRILFASNWALNCDGLCGTAGDDGDQQDYVVTGYFA